MEDADLAGQLRGILDVISLTYAPVMIVEVPSFVITAASPGAHELLDPTLQPLVGRSLMDFTQGHPSGAMPLLAAGRITGYETLQVLRLTGQRRRLWISALPGSGSTRTAIAVLLKEESSGRVPVPWKHDEAISPVIGSTDARLMVDRISAEVFDAFGYRAEELIGTSFLASIAAEDVPDVLLALAQTSRNREGVTLQVGVIGADLVPVTCQLALLPLTPAPSCAFALRSEESDGPADGRAVADLVTHLGRKIRGAMTSQAVVSPPLSSEVDLTRLSSRELEIVALLMAGHRVGSMARALFLSESTIRNHLSAVFGKLNVKTQQELIELLRPAPMANLTR